MDRWGGCGHDPPGRAPVAVRRTRPLNVLSTIVREDLDRFPFILEDPRCQALLQCVDDADPAEAHPSECVDAEEKETWQTDRRRTPRVAAPSRPAQPVPLFVRGLANGSPVTSS